jgi:hypothetical protein
MGLAAVFIVGELSPLAALASSAILEAAQENVLQ